MVIPLKDSREVESYYINALHLEIGDVYTQAYDKTLLVIELFGKITLKQIRTIEQKSNSILDSIMLHEDNGPYLEDRPRCKTELVFLRI